MNGMVERDCEQDWREIVEVENMQAQADMLTNGLPFQGAI